MVRKLNFFIIVFLCFGITHQNVFSNNTKKKHIVDTIYSNIDGRGIQIYLNLKKGKEHNHPTFAIWIEDVDGNFIQNLFVTKYIATGIFRYMPINDSTWGIEPGPAYRPAALPYWNHKRLNQPKEKKILPDENNPISDAYTGATPIRNFVLITKSDEQLPVKFNILLEINQTWDWNEYWTNIKFPGDVNYKSSCQPSIIYAVNINLESEIKNYLLNPIGHGHYSGMDGNLYTNLKTLTTALDIIESVEIKLIDNE